MRRLLGTVLTVFFGALAVPAAAGDAVVVELYTSQGCSSCPPADAILSELADREDVIALALHVDYWDYIGWKDSLARPEHTARQKGYAKAQGKGMVYTPQFIVGGQDHVTGSEPMAVAELVQKHRAAPRPIALTVRRDGEIILVEARAVGAVDGPVVVQVARFIPMQRVAITRGENAGRTFDFRNAVDLWIKVGEWNGQGTYAATARVAGDAPVAVIIQREGYGPVLAAARVP
jgi:hypothetical protein